MFQLYISRNMFDNRIWINCKEKFMRKLILAAALTLCFSVVQVGAANLKLGVKGGVNSAKIGGENFIKETADNKRNPGIMGGVSLGISGKSKFEFQPELLFVQKGTHYKDGDYGVKVELNYLELPLMLKWNYGAVNGSVRGFFNVGPYTSVLLSSNFAEHGNKKKYYEGFTQVLNKVDMGLNIGGGIGIKAGAGRILLDLRFALGFKTLDNSAADNKVLLNNVGSFMVGYELDLGKNSN